MSTALDTNVMISAVQGDPKNEALTARARAFLDDRLRNKEQLVLPTIVLTEFVRWYPEDKHEEAANEIEKRFRVVGFDASAAVIAATLWVRAKGAGRKSKLKVDCLVVATVKAHGVPLLVSNDPDIHKLGELCGLAVIDVPEVPVQTTLALSCE